MMPRLVTSRFHSASGATSRMFPASGMLLAATAVAVTAYGFSEYMGKDHFKVFAAEKEPYWGVAGSKTERTFIAVKPDGVQRGLIAEVIGRFEKKGYKLVGIKVVRPTEDFAKKHYDDLKDKPFFAGLVKFFSSGPVVAMVWEGKGVIKGGRRLVGATNPNDAEGGSVRGDLCIEVGRNVVHGSDGPESAKDEISLWFHENEVADWARTNEPWIHEK